MNDQQAEFSVLSVKDVVRILLEAWVGIMVLTVMGGGIAAYKAYTTRPVYQATAVLAVAADTNQSGLSKLAGQLGPIANLAGLGGSSGVSGKDVWLAILRSRHLLEDFIGKQNLLPILFAEDWDAEKKQWKLGKSGNPKVPTMEAAVKLLTTSVLAINEDRRAGLVLVKVHWTDRMLAAQWANDLVTLGNDYIRARVISEAQQSISFLEVELKKTNVVEIQQAIYGVIQTKISEAMMANVRKEYAFAVIDPAVAPEPNNYYAPRRRLMLLMGLSLGFTVGVVYAGVRRMLKSSRP